MNDHSEPSGAVIRIDRPLMEASISCPACGHHCACVGFVPGELALFACRHCAVRYYLGLGANPVLRVDSTAPTEIAS